MILLSCHLVLPRSAFLFNVLHCFFFFLVLFFGAGDRTQGLVLPQPQCATLLRTMHGAGEMAQCLRALLSQRS